MDVIAIVLIGIAVGAVAAGALVAFFTNRHVQAKLALTAVAQEGQLRELIAQKEAVERAAREREEQIRAANEAVQSLQKQVNEQTAAAAEFRARAEQASELREQLNKEMEARKAAEIEVERQKEERKALDEKIALLQEAREDMSREFRLISSDVMAASREALIRQANETFEHQKQLAEADLKQRQEAVKSLVDPLGAALKQYEEHLRQLEQNNEGALKGLKQQNELVMRLIEETRGETGKLVRALRQPQVRGRWGEVQLRRVAEMAGMLESCDFSEQTSLVSATGRQRPDMIVYMPGNRQAVVDAKVPIEAYLDAINAQEDDERRRKLSDHARHVREHVKKLGSKAYWELLQDTPAFTVMFVPDPFLSAALEHDPAIMEEAWRQGVVIATPMTLFTILHIVADDWRRARFEENSRKVVEAGRELYKRVGKFAEHFAKLGRGLGTALDSYNDAVGSLEGRVLPKAREFKQLEILSAQEKDLPELAPITGTPRALVAPELQVRTGELN